MGVSMWERGAASLWGPKDSEDKGCGSCLRRFWTSFFPACPPPCTTRAVDPNSGEGVSPGWLFGLCGQAGLGSDPGLAAWSSWTPHALLMAQPRYEPVWKFLITFTVRPSNSILGSCQNL